MSIDSCAVWVGIDWGHQEHQVCVLDGEARVVLEKRVKHEAEALDGLCGELLGVAGGDASKLRVAIEVPHGPVVETLLDRGIEVFAINPKQLDRFRDRYCMSGAKDDRRDAFVLADSLRTDRHCYRLLTVGDPVVVELRDWTRMRRDRVADRCRLESMMTAQLQRYYLQFLALPGDLAAGWKLELWQLCPTPASVAAVSAEEVAAILRRHRIRRVDAGEVMAILGRPAVTVGPGVVEGARARLAQIVEQLQVVAPQEKTCERRMRELAEELSRQRGSGGNADPEEGPSEVEILDSMPGMGPVIMGTLLSEGLAPLRAGDLRLLRGMAKLAPVTLQTGKKHPGGKYKPLVLMRRACNWRLADAMYHWGRVAAQRSPYDRARYAELRGRGHSHGRACRQVADGLLRVLCGLFASRTLYDASRRGRPVLVAAGLAMGEAAA